MMKRTQNNALTWTTSKNPLVDQYFQLIDGITYEKMVELLSASWRENKRATIVLLYDLRNCRGGKGRYELFSKAISCLITNFGIKMLMNKSDPSTWEYGDIKILKKSQIIVKKCDCGFFMINTCDCEFFNLKPKNEEYKINTNILETINHIPHYGSFKDLWRISNIFVDTKCPSLKFGETIVTDYLIDIFCKFLTQDCINAFGITPSDYNKEVHQKGVRKEKIKVFPNISMAAKYAPKKDNAHSKYFIKVRRNLNMTEKAYRWMCADLRKILNIVEIPMSSNEWKEIDFTKVHSVALKRYIKAFKRHSEEEFNSFLQKLRTGEAKANITQVYPHEFIKSIMQNREVEANSAFLDEYIKQKSLKFKNVVTICDTSASMYAGKSPKPIEVALGLTILSSWSNKGFFEHKFIQFSEKSEIVEIKGNNWQERINNIKEVNARNTNIQAAFDTILEQNEEIECVIVISDMQFDQCKEEKTNFEEINEKYLKVGKKRPLFVFWNVSALCQDSPVKSTEDGVILVSGYSTSIFSMIINSGGKITPEIFVNSIIESPMYERIQIE